MTRMVIRDRRRPEIGWREWVDFPELGIRRVKAKVDTGARSSALHAVELEIFRVRGLERIRFRVYPRQRTTHSSVLCDVPLHDERWVRSSNGSRELRPVIRTAVAWAGEQWEIDLTLTSRDLMGFRMLLGREAIRGRYLVNAGRSFIGERRSRSDESRRSIEQRVGELDEPARRQRKPEPLAARTKLGR